LDREREEESVAENLERSKRKCDSRERKELRVKNYYFYVCALWIKKKIE
jgi:hypothetical protein